MSQDASSPQDVIDSVRERYTKGAQELVPELCCPVDYDAGLLEVLPEEIVERDYGCGDPSRFVRAGDRVLDLGAGAGKICYMASQLVGEAGRVIGVDATDEMLALSRKWVPEMGRRIGWQNVEFLHGYIQDLALDRDALASWLAQHPVSGLADLEALYAEEERLRREQPLVADGSIDIVLSNCVLNLVEGGQKEQMFREIHRVLARGGRCAISDIVSDEDVPLAMQNDPELWSGCISGAMREDRFLQAFTDAGLYGVEIASRAAEPWAVVEGIEFRSLTVLAWKGLEGPRMEHNEAVIYKGPWSQVQDDDGHVYRRGERTAVCRKTYELMSSEPYAGQLEPVPSLVPVSEQDAMQFDCRRDNLRTPQETKSGAVRSDALPDSCCEPSDSCC